MHIDRDDVRRPLGTNPLRRIVAEAYCLMLTFIFHAENSNSRTAATLLVVVAWGLIEVGAAFGFAALPDQFFFLRLIVGMIIGRMWGIEINNFAGIDFTHTGSEDDTNDDD